jgi:hypothetical protein
MNGQIGRGAARRDQATPVIKSLGIGRLTISVVESC